MGGLMHDTLSQLRPEVRLLLLVGRRDVPPEDVLACIAGDFHWAILGKLAARERAVPYLSDCLHALPAGVVPSPVLELFRARSMVARFGAGCLEESLHTALRALASAGVEAMLLKGAALAATVYPGFAARPMQDLDLLVRTDEAARRAWRALLESGWTREDPRAAVDAFYAQHQHLPRLVYPSLPGARLELHRGLFRQGGPFGLSVADFFGRGRSIQINGLPAIVPSISDTLLYSCLHFAWTHEMAFGAWRFITDVATLAHASDDLWLEFLPTAKAVGGATVCYWALRMSASLRQVRLPENVLAELRPPLPGRILDALERHYATVAFPLGRHCPSLRLARRLWSLGILPRWSGHGKARPWRATEAWPEAGDGSDRGITAGAQVGPLRKAAMAVKYCSSLLDR
jgi:hypothetical protein